MQLESVEDSAFFLELQLPEYKYAWDSALLGHRWVLCVPQTCSFTAHVTRRDIENHILRPLESAGEFQTLNGKRVVILGNKVQTKAGFKQSEIVRILYTHDLLREGDKTIAVLFLNKPLEGGIDAPGEPDDMGRDMIMKFVALFKAHTELEGVMIGLEHFSSSILNICKSGRASQIRPSLSGCIANAVRSGARTIVACFRKTARRRVTESYALQIHQVVESVVMERLHETVFPLTRAATEAADRSLTAAIAAHHDYTKARFGVCVEFDCCLDDALAELGKLGACRTPLECAQCLARTSTTIKRLVELHYRQILARQPKASYKEFATDDLLSLVIFVVVQAGNPHHLCACYRYIEQYHFASVTTTAIGFHIAHFQVASKWLVDEYERKKSKADSAPVAAT